MSRVRVKICGITRREDLSAAVDAGADAVGFVVGVPSSPRNLSSDKAGELIDHTPVFVDSVVVTVPGSLSQLERVYRELNPSALQIHGQNLSDVTLRERLPGARLIRAVQAKSDDVIEAAVAASEAFDAVLLDSSASGKYGGTGKTHDWALSKCVNQAIAPKPLILAGGLRPENVRDAILAVRPYAVDVSSGVESHPGIKDPKRVSMFVRNAKEAETCGN